MSALAKRGVYFGDDVIAQDPGMLQVLETAQMLARHKAAVLITGETGSGKEVVARIIHRHSTRGQRPWIDVNCAALPEHLVESELFGYEKGAFSGADTAKPGLFEMANGGTLFLDEIGEINPRVQVKLLRVLDSVPFYRLGGTRKVTVDVRLIAATNRNLEAAVQEGSFRRDLYHRITAFHIAVPPLRERPGDVIALAGYFLAELRPDQEFTEEALELISVMSWPGNVRELRNFVTKLGIAVPHVLITADDVRQHANDIPSRNLCAAELAPERVTTFSDMERLMILRTLEATGGNQGRAAQQLGIPRRTFCRKLNEYQITLGRRKVRTSRTSSSLANCRAELQVPVQLTTHEGQVFVARSTDLSLGGMGLNGIHSPLGVSDEVTLRFALPDRDIPIEAKAVVAWYRPEGTAGVKFTCLSEPTYSLLRRWMMDNVHDKLPTPEDKTHCQLSA